MAKRKTRFIKSNYSLNLLLNDLKNQNEKLEKEKNNFRNNNKKYISTIIDEKLSQLITK